MNQASGLAVIAVALAVGCSPSSAPQPSGQKAEKSEKAKTTGSEGPIQVAFITNGVSDFWQIAHAGIRKAEAEVGASCEFRMPPNGTVAEQQEIVENFITKGVSGMAISPIDAKNQVDMLNLACAKMNVITHDSDAPKSNRICYVGTNNYKAGRQAGKLIREVLPNGGKITLFVGQLDALNAIERRAGIIDELKGLPDSDQPADTSSPATGLVQAGNVTVLDTRTDGNDRTRAKNNVEDTIVKEADIGCLVGLWAYNGPAILSAVKDAKKEGKIPIVCFDEENDTLQGVLDGHIHATVVQQPYEFGYRSVKILAALARGDKSVIPAGGVEDVPVLVVRKDNAREFWDNLKKLRGK